MSLRIRVNSSVELDIQFDVQEVYPPSHYAKNFVRILSEQPLKGACVLDAGCGTGVLGIVAAKLGADVTCSDLNPRALHWTRINAKANGVEVKCVETEGITAFLGKPVFDLVICNAPSNPGTYNPVVTPRDNGPTGRQFLDAVLKDAKKILRPDGRLLSCSNSEQDWRLTRDILSSVWTSYKIIADVDESFDGLSQFSPDQLCEWVRQGYCWEQDGVTYHNVRYFFAYA